jgi:hypothetical protein
MFCIINKKKSQKMTLVLLMYDLCRFNVKKTTSEDYLSMIYVLFMNYINKTT